MEIREYERYTVRQVVLPIEYRNKLEHVKRRIRMITGSTASTEITMMCLIDEFLSAHVKEEDVAKETETNKEENLQGGSYGTI